MLYSQERGALGLASRRAKKYRGLNQFVLVYAELKKFGADVASPTELLKAAQQLIDISRREYKDLVGVEYAQRANYYSKDVLAAMEQHPWLIVSMESSYMENDEIPLASPFDWPRRRDYYLNELFWSGATL